MNASENVNHKMKVPLHGTFKSVGVQLEEHMTTMNYQSSFKHRDGEKSGMSGKILSFGLSQKQKQSVLTENYLRF